MKREREMTTLNGENLVAARPKSIAAPIEEQVFSKEEIRNEMQKKGFRMEYQTVQISVSPEAAEAKKSYKKEKKVYGLDKFLENNDYQLQKSVDPFARGY